MTEISIRDLDVKPRKIIRAFGNINKALRYTEDTHPPEDLPVTIKALEVVGQAINVAWAVLREYARDIAIKHISNKPTDVVQFIDDDGEGIAALIIVKERRDND